MIPPSIDKRHIEKALDVLDRDGVPRGRESRRFELRARGRKYPPKLVVAIANEFANGRSLRPDEFSGGAEANSFLRERGYRIAVRRAPRPGLSVATVLLQTTGSYKTTTRLETMREVLDAIGAARAAPTLFVFPGGWFKAPPPKPADTILRGVARRVQTLLARHPNCVVSFGLDGSRSSQGTGDQLAVAVDKTGIRAIGRKFHPAPNETIWAPDHWDEGESGYDRVVQFGGRRYFLAVCYDSFGIKHEHLPRPKVDAVLDHVHGFWPTESPVLFARHGFAGASQKWRVPVYGAAVFHGRAIPPSWPSGVLWKGPPRSTMEWKYGDNPLHPAETFYVEVGEGVAEVRVFPS